MRNVGHYFPGDSKYGTGNLKQHILNCKRKHVKDIDQLLLQSHSCSLTNRCVGLDVEMFHELLALCVVKHDLSIQFTKV